MEILALPTSASTAKAAPQNENASGNPTAAMIMCLIEHPIVKTELRGAEDSNEAGGRLLYLDAAVSAA
jgi:hypothetical protein